MRTPAYAPAIDSRRCARLARMWRDLRMPRLADGPDEVHKTVIARRELKRVRGLRVRAA